MNLLFFINSKLLAFALLAPNQNQSQSPAETSCNHFLQLLARSWCAWGSLRYFNLVQFECCIGSFEWTEDFWTIRKLLFCSSTSRLSVLELHLGQRRFPFARLRRYRWTLVHHKYLSKSTNKQDLMNQVVYSGDCWILLLFQSSRHLEQLSHLRLPLSSELSHF